MLSFLGWRLVGLVTVLLAVMTITFALIHLGGDPIAALSPPGASAADQQHLRQRYGLDRPLPAQYLTYMGHAATGDFGDSWRQDRPALTAVTERLPRTLVLLGAAIGIAVVLGMALSLLAALSPGRIVGGLVGLVALLGQALPAFWLGTMLILLVAVHWRVLPSSGASGPLSLILPAVTLAMNPLALIVRLLRTGLRETLGADYIRTARSKGLREPVILMRHALRNAVLPVLSYVGLQAGFLVGGAVVVEAVFAWPGLGSLAYNAATDRDLPVIQAAAAVIAALIVLFQTAVDVIARLIDPRLAEVSDGAVGRSAVTA